MLQAQKTATEPFFQLDSSMDKIYVQGTTVPTDTTTGYAKGCIFIDTDVLTGTSGFYINKGTNTSCVFELAPVASTGTVTSMTVTSASATALTVGLNGATNPAFTVDSSTGSQAAGLKVVGATAAGTVAAVVTSSGADASLTINAKGTGTIGIGTVSTGAVTVTPATTITGALTLTAGIAAKFILASTETIASGGTTTALSLTKTLHNIDADAGGDIFTLADGVAGQIMICILKTATGVATITPATFLGGTSVTLNAAGDSVMFAFQTTLGWSIIGGNSYAVV